MQKILWIHENMGWTGGAEHLIHALATHLSSFSSTLLYSHSEPCSFSSFHTPFQHAIHFPFNQWNIQKKITSLLEREKPDLLFVHRCLSPSMMKALRQSKIPLVRMVHDHSVWCLRGTKMYPISRKVCPCKAGLCCLFPGLAFFKPGGGLQWPHYFRHKKLLYIDQESDLLIAPSAYMKNELILQGYPEENIRIVHPPVLTTPLPSISSEPILLYAGQVIRGKGIDCLIRAMSLIKSPCQLIVAGTGSFLDDCKRMTIALGLQEKVQFQGKVPQKELQKLYQKSTIGIVPSIWPEPFGMVGPEMMQQGLPVVAYASGGIPDWLEEGRTGYLVPPLSIEPLAEKISFLLEHPQLAKSMGEAGKKKALVDFSLPRYIQQIEELLCAFLS